MELTLKISGRFRLALLDGEACPDYARARAALNREFASVLQVVEAPNMIVTGGLNALSQAIAYDLTWGGSGFPTFTANLSPIYVAVGTSNAPAALAQTILFGEVARGAVTNAAVAAAQGVYDALLPTSVANATLNEVGMFLNATSTVNTGTMFDRSVLGSPVTKTALNTLLAELTLTLSN